MFGPSCKSRSQPESATIGLGIPFSCLICSLLWEAGSHLGHFSLPRQAKTERTTQTNLTVTCKSHPPIYHPARLYLVAVDERCASKRGGPELVLVSPVIVHKEQVEGVDDAGEPSCSLVLLATRFSVQPRGDAVIVIMMGTTAYNQMVSTRLISKSAPQPAMIATPAGGTVFAVVSAAGSEPVFQGFTD